MRFPNYIGICIAWYVDMRFLILLAVLLTFAFTATLSPALALLAITLAVIATLAFALLLAVTIASAAAAMLACAPGIALIYGHRFVDTRSPRRCFWPSRWHALSWHYWSLCWLRPLCWHLQSSLCLHEFSWHCGRFVDICGCRLVGRCHYLGICSLLGRFAGGCRYIGICSSGIALICGHHFVGTRSPGIAAIAAGRHLRRALLASFTVAAMLIRTLLVSLPLLLAAILARAVTVFLTVFLCIALVRCFCIDRISLTEMPRLERLD